VDKYDYLLTLQEKIIVGEKKSEIKRNSQLKINAPLLKKRSSSISEISPQFDIKGV
jgi:hypothetical protein